MPETIELQEAAPPVVIRLPRSMAASLVALGVCDATPALGDDGAWTISGVRKVGVLRVEGVQVQIQPKTPIRNLLCMLGLAPEAAAWRDDDVSVAADDSLTDVLAVAYAGVLERATARGLTRAYLPTEEASLVIRGHWNIGRQVRLGRGRVVPAEIDYDEFDVDTLENRLMRAAAVMLIRLPGLRVGTAHRLRELVARFDGVSTLSVVPKQDQVRMTRLNAHLAEAVRMAIAVLQRRGIEHHSGDAAGAAFLITMSTVFERFIEVAVQRAAAEIGVAVAPQLRTPLDRDRRIEIRPDLVLMRGGTVCAVIDAKYKLEKPAGYPNADIYQALAYAIRHEVDEAHLIYAKGLGDPAVYVIEQASVRVRCVAVDLAAPPSEIFGAVEQMVRGAVGIDAIG